MICVVEEPNDVFAIEKTNEYHGLYHVLGGALSPLDGIGPEDLKVRELLDRSRVDQRNPRTGVFDRRRLLRFRDESRRGR